jgi:predicted anti-sigma-YlaC factor YlaD
VDGVLSELDPAALAAIQQGIAHVDGAPTIPWGATAAVQGAVIKRHRERQEAQISLRKTVALWGGWFGRSVEEAQRAFWMAYGVDIGTAQTLGRTEAEALRERVLGDLLRAGIDTAVNMPHNAPQ